MLQLLYLFIKKFWINIILFIIVILTSITLITIKFINDDILLKIYIPRINLERNVYNMNSILNSVDLNLEILDESIIENNLYFIASHSGGGRASYFDKLVFLEKGDLIFIIKDNKSYVYVIDYIFLIYKDGYLETEYIGNENILYLITCSLEHFNKQLIVRSKLIS